MIKPCHAPSPENAIQPYRFAVSGARRASAMRQRACVMWFTGLSGAGKSTIANMVESRLHADARHAYVLDGDNMRTGLNSDLDFTDAGRVENIRRTAEVARLMADAGLIVLVSLISPFRRERDQARAVCKDVPFFEVYVDAPLAVCEERDPKGLYRRARSGEIKHFTGIDSAYEAPDAPDLLLRSHTQTAAQVSEQLINFLRERVLGSPDVVSHSFIARQNAKADSA